jgi:phosphoglycerate dehydrogenase-like enzyme
MSRDERFRSFKPCPEESSKMTTKVKIGLTADSWNEEGQFIIPGPGLHLLDGIPQVTYSAFSSYTPEVTAEQVEGFDLAVSMVPKWTGRTLAGNERLLAVLRVGVGYDMVDVGARHEAGVMLLITPEGVRRPMAVTIITLILALAMRLRIKDRIIREGRWGERVHHHGYGLVGKTLGSVGVGNIGHDMFRLALPFGMRHIAFDPMVSQEAVRDIGVTLVDFDTVLRESDFLNISCPLNRQTHHLVGKPELSKMKQSAFLINTARGPIVDETELIEALRSGAIRGAGLDVFEQEPVSPDNPLLRMENVILSPHSLGWTDELFMGIWNQNVRQVSQILRGDLPPEGIVNKEVLSHPGFKKKMKALLEGLAH